MSTTEDRGSEARETPGVGGADQKLEVVIIAVTDVDRATAFYRKLGWRLDATPPGIVQLTPPGSWCSVQFGSHLTTAAPGSGKGYLIVADIAATLKQLVAAGVELDEVYHIGPGGKADGLDPARGSYRSWASFHDPDGNRWTYQEVTTRLPGRVDVGLTSYSTVSDLADAMRRASAAHGKHEERIGQAAANWPDWYADYMAREQAGAELPT
jgi:catechol 2,3-dioxygenase-like lactoylglutathione lyase family enzyme